MKWSLSVAATNFKEFYKIFFIKSKQLLSVCSQLLWYQIEGNWSLCRFNLENTKPTYPDEEIDHESDVECEVDLLGGVLVVGDAVLHSLGRRIPEIDQERHHRENKHAENLKVNGIIVTSDHVWKISPRSCRLEFDLRWAPPPSFLPDGQNISTNILSNRFDQCMPWAIIFWKNVATSTKSEISWKYLSAIF